VYSYGTYDFDQPNFYLNFVQGHLKYVLSTYSMQEQYLMAEYEHRKVVKQELALDSAQKQALFDFLEWNALPEHRQYLYDFYLDNCSSRLRDVLKNCLGTRLVYDKNLKATCSFRDWMNAYLGPHPWSALGMNIGLGAPADQLTDYSTQMYLPINLKLAFSKASLDSHPLVSSEIEIVPFPEKKQMESAYVIPACFCILLFLSIYLTSKNDTSSWLAALFDGSLFAFIFILGTVLTLLWATTDHWVCAWNSDLLWANPFSFLYFLLFSKKIPQFATYSAYFLIGLSFMYMSLGYLFPEKPNLILFPLILAIQLRAIHRLKIIWKPHSL
jgi:hypothetical protein